MGSLPQLTEWRKNPYRTGSRLPCSGVCHHYRGQKAWQQIPWGSGVAKRLLCNCWPCLFGAEVVFTDVQKWAVFRTRMKKDVKFKLIKRQPVDPDTGVTSDHVIEMGAGRQKITLCKIGYYVPETGKHYVFLSNNFALDAKTWGIYTSRDGKLRFFSRKSSSFWR